MRTSILIIAFILMARIGFCDEAIRPTKTLITPRGFFAGFVFEINGKEYLLNSEGGILEITK